MDSVSVAIPGTLSKKGLRGISYDDLEQKNLDSKVDLGAAGSVMEKRTDHGVIREEILKTVSHIRVR